MKSSVSKDKMLSVEEGLTIHRNYNEDSCSNQAIENSKCIRCIQFTKLTFYIVMILYVGWFAMALFFGEYPYPGSNGSKDTTNEFMMIERNVDNTAVNSNAIPVDAIAQSNTEDDMTITSTEKNPILIQTFIEHSNHLGKHFSHKDKPVSLDDQINSNEDVQVSTLPFMEIEESSNEKSMNITEDIENFDSSERNIITSDESGRLIVLFRTVEKLSSDKRVNGEEESEKFDSSEERIISNDDSEMSTLPFEELEASSNEKSINVEENGQWFDSSNDKIISSEDSEISPMYPDLEPEKDIARKRFSSFWEGFVDDFFPDDVSNMENEFNDDKNEDFNYTDEVPDFEDHDMIIEDDYAEDPWLKVLPFFKNPVISHDDYYDMLEEIIDSASPAS